MTEVDLWKKVAAKLAVVAVKRESPESSQEQVEHAAAGLLAACVDRERRAGFPR